MLDRTRSFGTVYGMGSKHVYEQDGKVFDNDGVEVGATAEAKPEPAKAKPVRTAKAEPDQVDEQLNG